MFHSISGYGKNQASFGSRFYFSDDLNKNEKLTVNINTALNKAKDEFISSKDSLPGQNKYNMGIGISVVVPDNLDQYFDKFLNKENLQYQIYKGNEYFPSITRVKQDIR